MKNSSPGKEKVEMWLDGLVHHQKGTSELFDLATVQFVVLVALWRTTGVSDHQGNRSGQWRLIEILSSGKMRSPTCMSRGGLLLWQNREFSFW